MSTKAPKKSKPARTKRVEPNQKVKNVTVPFAKTQIITVKNPSKPPKRVPKRQQLIFSVLSSTVFQVNGGNSLTGIYRLNPSNQQLFPSLAFEAANYDMYRFKYLRMFYSQIVSVQQSGRISLMWDPDSQDVGPKSRVEISEYARSVSTAVYEACSLSIPTDSTWRFITDTVVADRKLVDYGQLFVATHSGNNFTEVGDVYLEYEIEFKNPQPTASLVQTGILDVGGQLTTNGPSYVLPSDFSFGPTDLGFSINLAGTFVITIVLSATNTGTLTIRGNCSLIGSSRGGYGSGNYFACFVVTSTGIPNSNYSININGLTGANRLQFVVTRCKETNALTSG